MKYPVETIAVSLAALLALLGAALARDDVFQTHMWVAFFALSLGAVMLLRQSEHAPTLSPANIPLSDNGRQPRACKERREHSVQERVTMSEDDKHIDELSGVETTGH